jgi:hypothetical protein
MLNNFKQLWLAKLEAAKSQGRLPGELTSAPERNQRVTRSAP